MDTCRVLKSIADERVNVYKENARFTQLVDEYHNGNTNVRNELWTISYRAACNWSKKRFGHWWSFEKINDLVMDILAVLFTRLDDKEKYPKGYRPLNLPSVVEQIFLMVYYNEKVRNIRENELSFDTLLEDYGDSIYLEMDDDYFEDITKEEIDNKHINIDGE